MGTIIKGIIVLILVLMIAGFLGINLPTLAKSALGLTEDIIPLDYTELNDQAITSFEDMKKDFEKCTTSQNINCKCSIDLNDYYQTHILKFDSSEMKLINIKNIEQRNLFDKTVLTKIMNGEGIGMASATIAINKVCDEQLTSSGDFDLIYFWNKPTIWGKTIFSKDKPISEDYQIYKSTTGELCWIIESVDKTKLNQLKEC